MHTYVHMYINMYVYIPKPTTTLTGPLLFPKQVDGRTPSKAEVASPNVTSLTVSAHAVTGRPPIL